MNNKEICLKALGILENIRENLVNLNYSEVVSGLITMNSYSNGWLDLLNCEVPDILAAIHATITRIRKSL